MNPKPMSDVSCCKLHIREAKKKPETWHCGRCGRIYTDLSACEACCKPALKGAKGESNVGDD